MNGNDIYQDPILQWADRKEHMEILRNADFQAVATQPLCGDRVTVTLRMANGRIAAMGYEIRGCLLARAACARAASIAEGMNREEIGELYRALHQALKERGRFPAKLTIFKPVRSRKSRHGCLLLVFEAIQKALDGQPRE